MFHCLFVCLFYCSLSFKTMSPKYYNVQFSSVQLLGHVRLFVTLWTAACQSSLSITNR